MLTNATRRSCEIQKDKLSWESFELLYLTTLAAGRAPTR